MPCRLRPHFGADQPRRSAPAPRRWRRAAGRPRPRCDGPTSTFPTSPRRRCPRRRCVDVPAPSAPARDAMGRRRRLHAGRRCCPPESLPSGAGWPTGRDRRRRVGRDDGSGRPAPSARQALWAASPRDRWLSDAWASPGGGPV